MQPQTMKAPRPFLDLLTSLGAWVRGYSLFIPLGLLILLLSRWMPARRFSPLVQGGCRLMLRAVGIRVAVSGRHHVPRGRACLFMCNHVNIFDVFVLYGHIPGYFRGVELDAHFDWFFYGPIIRSLGMIPISQTNGRSALKSLQAARQALTEGTSVLILPEGGRTPDGRLQPFFKGAFLLAKQAAVPVVPMAMAGAFAINRRGGFQVRPGRMALRFGRPMDAAVIARLQPRVLSLMVRDRISALISGDPA